MTGRVLDGYLISETGGDDGNIFYATQKDDGEIEDDERGVG